MKKKVVWAIACLAAIMLLAGCLESKITTDQNGTSSDPTLNSMNQSACKTNPNLQAKRRDHDQGLHLGVLDFEIRGREITIFHIDTLNACDAQMEFEMERENNHLILTEVNRAPSDTDCQCRMDLSLTLGGYEPGDHLVVDVFNEDHSFHFGSLYIGQDNNCSIECVVAEECWELGLAIPDCNGDFLCLENICFFECYSDDPGDGDWPEMECREDRDCPEGFYCEYLDYGWEECWADENGEEICEGWGDDPDYECWLDESGEEFCEDLPPGPEGFGFCVPFDEPPFEGECINDRDCPEGFYCEYLDYGWSDGDDPDYECWIDESGEEICENWPDDPDYECWIDDNGEEICEDLPPGPEHFGYCVPFDEPPFEGECLEDWDCPEGFFCEYYDYGHEECWIDEDGVEVCESWPDDPDYECWLDENGEEICEDLPPGPEYFGFCVPFDEPPVEGECFEDADCDTGFICMPLEGGNCWSDEDPSGEPCDNGENCCEDPDGSVYSDFGICVPADEDRPEGH